MNIKRITHFFYEVGVLRKIVRAHRQWFMEDDLSDNIASHSHRVSTIAYVIANKEKADIGKTLTMATFHDLGEARSGDQNWVHKRYVKVFEEEILKDQFDGLVEDNALFDTMTEYSKRESLESKIVKDSDYLDQYLLVKEYEMRGSQEAPKWLKDDIESKLHTETAKELYRDIISTFPGDWWKNLWIEKRR